MLPIERIFSAYAEQVHAITGCAFQEAVYSINDPNGAA